MIKIKEVIIVEGKYDKIRLSSLIDTLIITTDGFGIFKDAEKINMLRTLAKTRGLLVMTDSDSAGFIIRNYLKSCIDNKYIKQAYIPDILGKEKRKETHSKEGLLGVEGMSTQVLLQALNRAGVMPESEHTEEKESRKVTISDLYDDGLCGGNDSSIKRKKLLDYLEYPQRMSQKTMLSVINATMTFDEYKEIINKIFS